MRVSLAHHVAQGPFQKLGLNRCDVCYHGQSWPQNRESHRASSILV